MFALVQGKPFTTADIPEDVREKREKLQKKEENREKKAQDTPAEKKSGTAPKRTNTAAQRKKIKTQMDGLDLAEKLLLSIIRDGFGTLTPKTVATMETLAFLMLNATVPGDVPSPTTTLLISGEFVPRFHPSPNGRLAMTTSVTPSPLMSPVSCPSPFLAHGDKYRYAYFPENGT